MRPPEQIVWVDPGKLNGFAWYSLLYDEMELYEFDGPTCIRRIESITKFVGEYVTVGCERFIITTETPKKSQDGLASIEMMGMIRRAVSPEYSGVGVYEFDEKQSSSDAKTFCSDRILSALGWRFKGGGGHAEDAARHIIYYLNKHHWLSEKQLDAVLPPEK
mgnify:CR=1 FL=1